MPSRVISVTYDLNYTLTFHSPGIEPWISGVLRQFKPSDVLDVGCGLGLWGLILKGYLGCPRVVGVDVDHAKIEFARRLGIYDELYASDVRAFSYPKPFDAIMAVEAVHGFLDAELLGRLDGLAKRGGLIVLALPTLPRSIATSELAQRGYVVYRYFLRGFILVRIDKAEVRTTPSGLWRALGYLIRLFSPMLKLLGVLERGYLLAYKVV
jgi:predicted TPR repeat methyltransferase